MFKLNAKHSLSVLAIALIASIGACTRKENPTGRDGMEFSTPEGLRVEAHANSVKLRWLAVTEAYGYLVEIAKGAGFTNPFYRSDTLSATELEVTDLDPETDYVVRLKAVHKTNPSITSKGLYTNFKTGEAVVPEALLAFPGAEGYGKYATGGRGGKVVEVTTLNDAGPGSFRQAFLEYPGEPITIVFRVGGIIELLSPIKVNRSNITVAGQTAPGDGICLRGHSFIINGARAASLGGNHGNIIIRYLRSRPGSMLPGGVYGFDMENCHDVIIDHCSFSWANEECAALYDTKYTTVQWCIASEGLYSAGHAKGNRGYGGVWGGQYATYHHNLIANQNARATRFSGARAHDTVARVDYTNNVIYNWANWQAAAGGAIEIEGGASQINLVNNYYKPGPATHANRYFCTADYNEGDKGIGQWFVSGNVMEGETAKNNDNWLGMYLDKVPQARRANTRVNTPFEVVQTVVQIAQEAYVSVLNGAGARRPVRDVVDARIVQEAQAGTAMGMGIFGKPGIIDAPGAVGGWPVYTSAAAPVDTDHDGMPDEWERNNGLNPNDPEDRNLVNNTGYTKLELFLNSLVQ